MRRWIRILGVLAALALLAAACGDDSDDEESSGDTAEEEATDDTAAETTDDTEAADAEEEPATDGGDGAAIVYAIGSEPTSLDPHLVDDGGERAINDNVYETLVARTPDGELIPGLATDLPAQLDDTTWQVTLRDGIEFHNGEPFNAESVVASVDRIMRLIEQGVTDNDGFFASFTGAEAIDDLTVNITTAERDGVVPSRLYWLKMIPASAADADDLSDSVVGTGPYRFVEWVRGESATLEANPDYWDGAPAVAQVEYRFISESGSRLAGLLAGDYDLIANLNPSDVPQAPQSATVQGQEHPVLILDADEGITADPNVRLALNLAVDKQAIADSLFEGFAVIDNGQLLSPSILGHNPDLEPYPYDPEEAAKLIADAGVTGETITLVGESSGRWLLDAELVQAVAGYWEEAGLVVDLQLPEFGEYLDVLFADGNRADAIFVSSSNDLLDADRQLSSYYAPSGIGASNSNEQLQELVDSARAELDPDAREALYQEAVALAYDEAYFVWLINNEDIYGLSERLQWQPRVDSKVLIKEMTVSG